MVTCDIDVLSLAEMFCVVGRVQSQSSRTKSQEANGIHCQGTDSLHESRASRAVTRLLCAHRRLRVLKCSKSGSRHRASHRTKCVDFAQLFPCCPDSCLLHGTRAHMMEGDIHVCRSRVMLCIANLSIAVFQVTLKHNTEHHNDRAASIWTKLQRERSVSSSPDAAYSRISCTVPRTWYCATSICLNPFMIFCAVGNSNRNHSRDFRSITTQSITEHEQHR